MTKLPKSAWLNLSETMALVVERTAEAEPVIGEALHRAFRNNEIRTRARSYNWFRHDTQADLHGVAWDRASINWIISTFTTPKHWREVCVFEDVEVERKSLERWLNSADPKPVSKPSTPVPAPSFPGRPSIMEAIVEELKRRAAAGEICQRVTDESNALKRWVDANNDFKGLQHPTARTIENNIRNHFRKLNPRDARN